MASSYDKMKGLFESLENKQIVNDKYEGVICGFHFAWDDSDSEKLIVAILKEKSLRPGIKYRLRGDVFITHEFNELGYDFLPTTSAP